MKDAIATLKEPFNVRKYVDLVMEDLRDGGVLSLDIPSDCPVSFRSAIKAYNADAVAEQSLPASHVAALRQVEACVSKLPTWGAVSNQTRRERAMKKFIQAEKACARANRRAIWFSAHMDRLSRSQREVVNDIKYRLWRMLGDLPSFEDFSHCGFGPGLTFAQPGGKRHVFYKLNGDQTVTQGCKRFALEVLSKLFPNWAQHLAASGRSLTVIKGNRLSFVPKSSEIYRTIAVEPSLNVFLQNGVDRVIRNRARLYGLRLNDQDFSINRMMEGYASGEVATIDLASASDTLAYEVVRWLFPKEWFDLVDSLRSPEYTLDKGRTWSPYQKFSSMGNGTTFPLESLLFFATAQAVTAYSGGDLRKVRVYGDDIIVEPRAAGLLIEILRLFGFRTNTDKTFVHGRFRECCGTDIYDNIDIRPVYLRGVPEMADDVANLYNRLATNRFGFLLPKTLHYLLSLVSHPLFGPCYIGPSGEDLREVRDWYAGKAKIQAAFFWGDPVEKPRRHRDWQSDFWTLESWSRKQAPMEDPRRIALSDAYIGFLYGCGGVPKRVLNVLKIKPFTFTGEWPDLSIARLEAIGGRRTRTLRSDPAAVAGYRLLQRL